MHLLILIKLTAPNLKDFECGSFVTQHYSLGKCSLLSNVQFDIRLKERLLDENAEAWLNLSTGEKQVYAKRMMRFLGVVYMVKEIWLSSGFLEVLSGAADLLDCQPPRLCNLQYLSLQNAVDKRLLAGYSIFALKISPRSIYVYNASHGDFYFCGTFSEPLSQSNLVDVGDDWEAGLSSPGMLSHLDHVTFDEVEGCDAELKLLSFLLKHAKVLRKVALSFRAGISSPDGVRERKLFRDKLRALPTASSSIQMMF
ncbi:hypothetical protein C5167_007643 [Papaver somniferum]|nr:hypothetical protein C5167_007643 [Papaver somniferum]